jgi:hypothetical protein
MRGRVSLGVAAPGLVATIAIALPASGQPAACGSPDRPRVEISGSGADMTAVATLLRAELTPRGIDLCLPGDDPGLAVATVSVSARPDGASIDVEVHDRLTAKRVSRDVDLGGVPVDGRSLTLAVVADELLRASWAELALSTAPPPARPVPPAIRDTVEQDVSAPTRGLTTRLEALAEIETWAGALTLYGLDLRLALASGGLGVALRLGARGAPASSGPDGQVQTTVVLGGAGVSFRATPWSRYGIDAIARADVARVAFGVSSNPGASGAPMAETTVLVGAGVDGWATLGRTAQLVGEVLVSTPLRAVAAQDGGRSIVALSGAGVEGGAGIRVAF